MIRRYCFTVLTALFLVVAAAPENMTRLRRFAIG